MAELLEILSDADLAALRAGYDYTVMEAAFTASVIAPYGPGGAWVKAQTDHFYALERMSGEGMAPVDRERCVLAILAPRGGTELAIHVYWGLALGLSVRDLLDIFFLAGTYGGVPAYKTGLDSLRAVLPKLKAAVDAGHAGTAAVLGALFR
ncbi:MAG: hypothetical protein H6702_24650 [Myxococcales bacterium]|nr:hypothetical protein [Myxococcales bacterium]